MQHKTLAWATTTAITAVLLTGFINPANADTAATAQAAEVATAVQAATGTTDVVPASQTTTDSNSAAVATAAGKTVDVPKDPSTDVTITTPGREQIGIGIANGDNAHDAKTNANGTTVYADPATGSATAVQPTTDGGLRQSLFIASDAAPSEYRIPVTMPEGFHLRTNGDGSIDIVNPTTGDNLGEFATPWATDAAGKPVATSYRVDGSTIVQTVDLTEPRMFPVIADPHYGCSWWSGCTIYLNKTETKNVSYGANIVGWIPNVWTVIGGRYVWAWAQLAANQGKCIKISNVFWIYIYSGKYCN
jgi:hypothetical protein